MTTIKEKIIKELNGLVQDGRYLLYAEAIKNDKFNSETKDRLFEIEEFKKFYDDLTSFKQKYQKWFTKSLPVIRQVVPDRYEEFKSFYKLDKRRDDKIDFLTYTISDYLIGLSITRGLYKEEVVNPYSAFYSKFESQLNILESCLDRIESSLSDIEGIIQSEYFDNEIGASKELLKKKHIRASGMLVGVILEGHLKKVCSNHSISFRKKNLTISDYNEELKKQSIIDVPTWRLIQRLGDIRNLCAHLKEREPKVDEIEDLIRGTEKLIGELY